MTVTQSLPEVDLASTVARRVRGLLGEYQMKQAELAMRLGLSTTAMSHRLSGNKDFDLVELPALAAALEVSIEYLLGLADERSPRRTAPGGGSTFVLDESGRTPPRTRTENPLIKSHHGAEVILFPLERRRAAATSASAKILPWRSA